MLIGFFSDSEEGFFESSKNRVLGFQRADRKEHRGAADKVSFEFSCWEVNYVDQCSALADRHRDSRPATSNTARDTRCRLVFSQTVATLFQREFVCNWRERDRCQQRGSEPDERPHWL
jgi:hypothetical protein